MTSDGSSDTTDGVALESGLYVVGTPIGNLGDLTPRAALVLTGVDAVVCEDTRRTGKLISHAAEVLGITGSFNRPALLVGNEHTEQARVPEVLDRLADYQSLALVSDAGMPSVSDPGTAMVAAVADAGHKIFAVPGPSAVSAALAVSGLLNGRYVFEGFLPRKGRSRSERLQSLAADDRVTVIYESPNRLTATLRDLSSVCGADRRLVVARELTKLHEEVIRVSASEAAEHFAENPPRGEIVIVVDGVPRAAAEPVDDESLRQMLAEKVNEGLSRRDAVAAVVMVTGAPKRRVYDLANSLTPADNPSHGPPTALVESRDE